MGPRRHIRGTYSKLRQGQDTDGKCRPRHKDRRLIPQFNDLFLPKDENREASGQESFDSLKERLKKPGVLEESTKVRKSKTFRKPLAVNSLLTNSSVGSVGHSSADDTFDQLMGKASRLPVGIHQSGTEGLSSSNTNSSFDATGLLYQSLQSHVQSQLYSSTDNKSKLQIIKETEDNIEVQSRPSVIFEDCGSIGDDKSPHNSDKAVKDVKSVPLIVSPQLFSSNDEQVENIKSHKSKKRKSKIAKKIKKPSKSYRKNKNDNESEQPDITDSQKEKNVTGKSNCNDFASGDFGNPQNVFENPLLSVQTASDSPPYVTEKGAFPFPAHVQLFKGFTCTPENSNYAKAILHQKIRLSQNGSSVTSELSVGSYRSGHSSEARTSTPADTSRNKSLINDLGSWNIQGISPVSTMAKSNTNSPSHFQSPVCSYSKSGAFSNQKSGDNPSNRSHYHTCVSCSGGSGDSAKLKVISSPKSRVCKGVTQGCNKIFNYEKPGSFYNSFSELKSGPFKGITIPVFDNTQGASLTGHRLESCDRKNSVLSEQEIKSEAEISADKLVVSSEFTAVTKKNLGNEKVSQVSDGNVLHEISQNFSSGMLKQINSFLSRPSFSVPLRTRQQKRKILKNKKETISNIKRLTTRHSARISKRQKKQSYANNERLSVVSQNEIINTDHSTTTEPSPVFPRIGQRNVAIPLTANFCGPRMDETHSSVDSVFSNGLVLLPKSNVTTDTDSIYFAKPSPVLPRRASVRLATKRKIMTRRTSVRLAMKMENSHVRSTASLSRDNWSESENVSRVSEKAYVSTRSSLKRLRPTKKLSIMQFSLLSVKSANTDNEDSKASIVSGNGISCNESLDSHRGRTSLPVNSFTNVDIHQSVVLGGDNLENQVIKEEASEESSVSCESDKLPARDSTSDVRLSLKHPSKMREVSVAEDLDALALDVSLDDAFIQPFQTAVPTKRGKGWIRSLSIARASFLGTEKIRVTEMERRQTVHRMSVGGRRMTCLHIAEFPEISVDQIAEVEESCNEIENPLSQSILHDPRRHVLTLCSQVKPLPVTDCFSPSRLSCCRKIGEGVYGEVFMTKPNPNNMEGATVLKIMPIEGDFDVNGEMQKKFDEILSEIIISLELSNLRNTSRKNNWTENFVHVLNCWCVEGSYHQDMLYLWDLYHEEKGSENDRPDIFPDSQLYIVLEFTHGGRDLEGFVFNNASQSLAVFLQIAYSLAVAEQELEFEHRDLHWGNVLVAASNEKSLDFQINGGTYKLQTQGVKATVIDFTLSRLKAPHCIMYNNLAEDPSLFTAEGDYQFEIYRQMKKANRNDWQSFTPYTNILWLHYILDKMIKECYYKNVKSKVHKTNLDLLCKLKNNMLQSESATAFVLRREHGID